MLEGERQVAPTLDGIRRDHLARYEWVAKQLPPGSAVLDLACGVGYGSYILAQAGHTVIGMDRDAEAIAYAKANYAHPDAQFMVGDVSDLAEDKNNLDAVISFETIEHIDDPAPFLIWAAKNAKALYASVPNEAVFPFRCEANGFQGWAFHYRHYTKAQFADLLRQAGWGEFEWAGQGDKESEVGDVGPTKGRNIIVAAKPAGEAKAAPKHVAILGLGPSLEAYVDHTKRIGGRSAFCDEVWGINAVGDVIACDRIFHMDDVRVQEARATAAPKSNIANMLAWLKAHPGPIYTSVPHPDYPGLVDFPFEEVMNACCGVAYFNSTAAYAVAYAIYLGVEQISLFGCDFTYPNAHQAEKGRACMEFYLGIAKARGIEIALPDVTSLMDAISPEDERVYGYDGMTISYATDETGWVSVEFTPRALPTAEAIEKRYDHSSHPNPLVAKPKEPQCTQGS
jgi:SAM-dependent methyltransferase